LTITNTPPSVTSVSSSDTTTTATITWNTNESANSTVYYGVSGTIDQSTTSASFLTSHSVELTSLTSATLYDYIASSCDQFNLCTNATQLSFTTDTTTTTTSGSGGGGGGGGGGSESDDTTTTTIDDFLDEIFDEETTTTTTLRQLGREELEEFLDELLLAIEEAAANDEDTEQASHLYDLALEAFNEQDYVLSQSYAETAFEQLGVEVDEKFKKEGRGLGFYVGIAVIVSGLGALGYINRDLLGIIKEKKDGEKKTKKSIIPKIKLPKLSFLNKKVESKSETSKTLDKLTPNPKGHQYTPQEIESRTKDISEPPKPPSPPISKIEPKIGVMLKSQSELKPTPSASVRIVDILGMAESYVGKKVTLTNCRVMPLEKGKGGHWHTLTDGTGYINGYSKEKTEGDGILEGNVKKAKDGNYYIEF